MKTDIKLCKEIGCDGIVIGILNADGTVDKERCRLLVDLAYPLGVTFHRAFDRVINAGQALEDVIETGCERILTSGLKPTAMEGIETLASLIHQADERIIIMPGSGVRAENITELAEKTGATEFHSSARIFINSKMEYYNPAMRENLKVAAVDENEVRGIIKNLKRLVL
jgi:copper homeostasis protein